MDLPPVRLLGMGFVIIGLFARHRGPRIRSCSSVAPLLRASFRPALAASVISLVALRYHFTSITLRRKRNSKLSNILGTPNKGDAITRVPWRLRPTAAPRDQKTIFALTCPMRPG